MSRPGKKDPHREIERKFLVRSLPGKLSAYPHKKIEQGYLAATRDGMQVRLRRAETSYSLTYKQNDGRSRIEREVELTPEQFAVLWPATNGKRLSKTRYEVPLNDLLVEVDVYRGRHAGLIVAEVEFASERAARQFEPPAWLGREVTGSTRYSNVRLALT
jgi:adenylate cyclase